MVAFAARRMGYLVHVYSPDGDDVARPFCDGGVRRELDDLISVRQFAKSVDVVTATDDGVPAMALEAANEVGLLRPGASSLTAVSGGAAEVDTGSLHTEFAVIGARGLNGHCVFYPPIAVDRADGRIEVSRMPASIGGRMAKQAMEMVRSALEQAELVGVAAMEFRLTEEHELRPGQFIPHLYSGGQLTIEGCVTSQYEQHLRAICGLPLGSADMLRPTACARLQSDASTTDVPDWVSVCALPGVKFHLYGPTSGHVTALAATATIARQIVSAARMTILRA